MILLSSQESGSDSDVSGSSTCDTCYTPRIVLCMVLSVNSDSREDFWQNNIHLDDTHIAVDTVTWWLQYLNHSINFFVYVLAIKKFRFSS